MSVKMRQIVEKEIFEAVVKSLVKDGFLVSIDNGAGEGETPYEIHNSKSVKAIVKASMATDEETLYVRRAGSTPPDQFEGWVKFVYGNDGWDVVSDYTVNLERLIGEGTEIDAIVNKYAD